MSNYQVLQLLQAGLCMATLVALCAYAARIRGENRPPIVTFGMLVAGGAVLAFGTTFLVAGQKDAQRLEIITRLLREVPAILIVSYGCLVQSRRYRGAKNRPLFRKWFAKAPLLLAGALLLAGFLGLLFPYPTLEIIEPLPIRALFLDAVWIVPLAIYSALTAFVFIEAIGQEIPGLRQHLQNLSAAVGMVSISLVGWDGLFASGLRVFGTPEQIFRFMPMIAHAQVVLIGATAVGFAVAVVSYCARDSRTDFTERFLRFVEVVGGISEVVENAPISKMGLNVEYKSLLEAAGEEFLNLAEAETRKLDDAFRVAVLWASRSTRGRLTQLLHLARIYDEELARAKEGEPKGAFLFGRCVRGEEVGRPSGAPRIDGMARECDVTDDSCQPGMHEMLWFTINMVEQSKGRKETWEDLRNAPEWMQLCAVALADAAILGARHQDILEGEAVAQRIRDAYLLARWKVGTVRMSFGPYN